MAHFYGSHLVLGIYKLALLWAMFPLTVGGNIIWLEPPPFETVTDSSSNSRTNKTVIQGSLNEELSCNFNLTADLSIISVSMKFRGQPAVTFVPNVMLRVEPVFANHFNAVWVPNKLSLTLFNVTDAEEGQYCCEVITMGSSAQTWIRKIQLLVLDPSQATVSSIAVLQLDPIQTTISGVTASEVGGNIIWLEPPPFETVTDSSSISRTNKTVIQGSLNEELSCTFNMTADLSIISVSMKFRGHSAVTFVPNQSLSVEPDFANHFNAVWVPNKLMLTLFNVTDAEGGQYCCEVITSGRSGRTWIRKIQLLVVDPSQATVSSIAVLQHPIQTTVSGVTASEDKTQTMVSSTTVPPYSIPTTASSVRTLVVDVPWRIILPVLCVASAIAIAIVWCLRRKKRFKRVHHDRRNDSEGIEMRSQAGDALPGPPAADGINGSQSRTNIPG